VTDFVVNIDVDDLDKATRFYCDGLGLRVGRRFDGWIELLGGPAPIYLLPKAAGTPIAPSDRQQRSYGRHWTPVHLDFVVSDIGKALARALAATSGPPGGSNGQMWTPSRRSRARFSSASATIRFALR